MLPEASMRALLGHVDAVERYEEAERSEELRLREPFRQRATDLDRAYHHENVEPPPGEIAQMTRVVTEGLAEWRSKNRPPGNLNTPAKLLREVRKFLDNRSLYERCVRNGITNVLPNDKPGEVQSDIERRLDALFVTTGLAPRLLVKTLKVDDGNPVAWLRKVDRWLAALVAEMAKCRDSEGGNNTQAETPGATGTKGAQSAAQPDWIYCSQSNLAKALGYRSGKRSGLMKKLRDGGIVGEFQEVSNSFRFTLADPKEHARIKAMYPGKVASKRQHNGSKP